jgi:imidazolonepropionase-like amidohydrolase
LFAIASVVSFALLAPGTLGGEDPQEGATPASPGAGALIVRGEKIVVRPGEELENASVLVQDGRIVAVGANLEAPEGAREIRGKVVCPGFVDAWSSFGLDSTAWSDDRVSPASRATDAADGYVDRRIEEEVLLAGVTSYRIQATVAARALGIGALLRVDPGRSLADSIVVGDCCIAFTCGTTRGGRMLDVFDRVADVDRIVGMIADGLTYLQDSNEHRHDLEEWKKKIAEKEKELEDGFKKAKKDREKEEAEAKEKKKEFKEKAYKEDKRPSPPRYDEDKEAMARVASGELPLIVEAHRAAELRNLLEGTKRFERLRLVIAGGTEALAVADELKEREIPVIVWPAPLGTSRSSELERADLALAGRLEAAGVEVLLGSGAASSRDLPLFAALAVGHGLSKESAFAALTVRAARALDASDRIGSIEVGKDADLIVLDGEPFATTTRVRAVVCAGALYGRE